MRETSWLEVVFANDCLPLELVGLTLKRGGRASDRGRFALERISRRVDIARECWAEPIRMFPDFVCIGAPKAGTTWLYRNLREHPQIWMPPVKAIRYFKEPGCLPICTQIFGSSTSQLRWRRLVSRLVTKKRIDRAAFEWYLRFLFMPRTDSWYASLFRGGAGQVAGEVTAAYARLPEDVVARIYSLMPDLKIVYVLRNPIERLWSEAAMNVQKRRSMPNNHLNAMIQAVYNKPSLHGNTNYLDNLQRWEKYFPPDQIYVGFFEQLTVDPRGFLRDLQQFLGVDASGEYLPEEYARARNTRRYAPLPRLVRAEMAEKYIGMIRALHTRYSNASTECWLEFATSHGGSPECAS